MAGPAVDYVYQYSAPSTLSWEPGGPRLRLATSGGEAARPRFFEGGLLGPRRTAESLLALVRVVRSRFHVPAAMLARILAAADPVVTCGGERLRFEAFSACCSAYARLDLLPEALDGEFLGRGTTNVDFNAPMRTALARIGESDTVRLAVGADEVELASGDKAVIERKVPLPTRWLKGFVEVQAHQARMQPCLEVSGAEARRFLRALPRQGTRGRPAWIVPAGKGLRLGQTAARGAVRVGGVERLRVLEELSRHARTMRIYSAEDGETSAWELTMEDARFHLVLSPEVWRGFSGEGQVLSDLAETAAPGVLARVRAALHWQPRLDPAQLAGECHLDRDVVAVALARLAASGMLGYDLSLGAYFHRVLPYDLALVERLQPRLRDARRLLAEDGVRLEPAVEDRVEAWVRGTGVEHHVRLTPEGARCTCPWFARHQGDRGPCKHILAVQIRTGGNDDT